MKNFVICLLALFAFGDTSAQVAKRVLLEHTTNTLCSVCNRRNPDLKVNLANNPDVIYMSIHPSAPYAACILNQHNKSDNDGRTNYYGFYGATPKIAINGAQNNRGYSDTSLFTPYRGMNTEVEVSATIVLTGSNGIKVKVDLETKATHSYGSERIFVALVEDTIFYNAPNGETQHQNVLRDALTAPEGDAVTFPAPVGGTSSLDYSGTISNDWDLKRIRAIVIVQKSSDKDLIQAYASDVVGDQANTVGLNDINAIPFKFYPNPTRGQITVDWPTDEFSYAIRNTLGQVVTSGRAISGVPFGIGDLQTGVYLITVSENGAQKSLRLIVE